jgi:hypothetical protein
VVPHVWWVEGALQLMFQTVFPTLPRENPMTTHAKRDYRPRPRLLGAVAGAVLLLGGGFVAQAVADSGPKPAPVAPDAAPAAPKVVTAPKPVAPKPVPAPASAAPKVSAPKPTPAPVPAPAGDAPRVIAPGK